jgi:hypothetical protein
MGRRLSENAGNVARRFVAEQKNINHISDMVMIA